MLRCTSASNVLIGLLPLGRCVLQALVIAHVPPGVFEKHRDYHWYYPLYNEAFVRLVRKHAASIGSMHMAHHHTDSFRLLQGNTGQPPLYPMEG